MIVALNLRGHGDVKLEVRERSTSWLLRLAPWTRNAWVTIAGVIYLPADTHIEDVAERIYFYESTLAHEYVHVLQQRRLTWPLFLLAYALLPVPFLAPWRARLEAEAYGHQCLYYGASYSAALDAICSGLYFWPVPRFVARWMLLHKAVFR